MQGRHVYQDTKTKKMRIICMQIDKMPRYACGVTSYQVKQILQSKYSARSRSFFHLQRRGNLACVTRCCKLKECAAWKFPHLPNEACEWQSLSRAVIEMKCRMKIKCNFD